MSKWREIRCDFFNEEEEEYYVDAWKTGNDNEEGKVIAKIDLANGTVEYLDEDAKTDEDAQVVINEFLENGYVLTEQSLNNDFNNELEENIMVKTIKAGTYKVEIEFTLQEDTLETTIDNIFEDAMYNNFNDISESDIGEYIPVEKQQQNTILLAN